MKSTLKSLTLLVLAALLLACGKEKHTQTTETNENQPIVLAYTTYKTDIMPDPTLMTHICYAFGLVNDTHDGVVVRNMPKLMQLPSVRAQNPNIKLLLSVGGWEAGGFSEMAADSALRHRFALSCKAIVDTIGLDGIDIDWEYPTSSEAGISSSPEDTKNFTLLMKELRNVLGDDKLLAMATIADAWYIDFASLVDVVDFASVMMYDVARPPYHHSGLRRTELAGRIIGEEALQAHLNAGFPKEKLLLGMPLYGHGIDSIDDFIDYKDIVNLKGYEECWDSIAEVPYLRDKSGKIALCYDDARSLTKKCEYVLNNGFRGVMYWEYDQDSESHTLTQAVANAMLRNQKP